MWEWYRLVLIVSLCAGILNTSAEEADDRVIDLQELLQGVSATLQEVRGTLTNCKGNLPPSRPKDCSEVYRAGHVTSGVYRIWPESWELFGSFDVLCDMDTDGGGWTVIQKRGNFSLPNDFFLKNWSEYKRGFGELTKEFWLGNDRIFGLTNQDSYELRVDMTDLDKVGAFAAFSQFWIENEDQLYRIQVGGFSGTAGDSLSGHSGHRFSTVDRDHDTYPGDCATQFSGAWWYASCHASNLNGLNLLGPHATYANGVEWSSWKGQYYSLLSVEMKIRPKAFVT